MRPSSIGRSPAPALAGTVMVLLSASAPAGAAVQLDLLPHVAVSEIYDDNVFGVPSDGLVVVTGTSTDPTVPPETRNLEREDDFITRIGPGIGARLTTGLFSLSGGYRHHWSFYANNSDLDSSSSGFGGLGALHASYQATELLTLSLGGSYHESESSRDINRGRDPLFFDPDEEFVTGVESGRGRSRSYSVGPSATYRWSALTTVHGGYRFAGSSRRGESFNHHGVLGLDRMLTAVDTGTLTYTVSSRSFEDHRSTTAPGTTFVGDEPGGSLSHTIRAGWRRILTDATILSLEAGPRLTDGEFDSVEARAMVGHSLDFGHLSIGYMRTQSSVIGAAGTVDSDRVWAGAAYSVFQNLGLWSRLQWFHNDGGNIDTNSVLAEIGTGYLLTQWMSVDLNYDFRLQDKPLIQGTVGGSRGDVYRNLVQISLRIFYPIGQAQAGPFPWLGIGSAAGTGWPSGRSGWPNTGAGVWNP